MIAVTSGRFQSFLWLGLLVLLIAVVTAWYFLPIKDFVDFLSEWISKHGALGVVIFAACRPGDDTRRKLRQPPQGPRLGGRRAQPPRAAHLRGVPARRRTDHAQGARGRVRRLARARAPDRRAWFREGAEVGEERRRCDGNSSASAAH